MESDVSEKNGESSKIEWFGLPDVPFVSEWSKEVEVLVSKLKRSCPESTISFQSSISKDFF